MFEIYAKDQSGPPIRWKLSVSVGDTTEKVLTNKMQIATDDNSVDFWCIDSVSQGARLVFALLVQLDRV